MTEEERTRELEHIKENLLMIKQIIGEHRNNYDDALTQLGRIMARTEFALESVENLKSEIRSVGNGKRIIAKLKNGGNMIKIGDEVVDMTSGISGVVIKQYYPTACEQQTMIQCDDGRKYHAPTIYFVKKDYISDSDIDKNPYLNDVGKYAANLQEIMVFQ